MSRPKRAQKRALSSAEIEAEIRRLQEEREHAIEAEDQRRGALIREYLAGKNGDGIRSALERVVSSRDAYLFRLDGARAEQPLSNR